MPFDNFRGNEHNPLVTGRAEESESLLADEEDVLNTTEQSMIGVEVVGRTVNMADSLAYDSSSQWDGAEMPVFRGVRTKVADLPITHSHL